MKPPRWISLRALLEMHAEMVREHGGEPGLRRGGEALVESALARPIQKLAYEPETPLAHLAAAYLFGLVKNHGFLDGNKRTGLAAAATFLRLNGSRLVASESEAYQVVMDLAANRISEVELAAWFVENSSPKRPR